MSKETYTPTNWKDHVVERPRTYTPIQNEDGTITLYPAPGTIEQQGTPITASNLNNMETGIAKAMPKANYLTEEEVAEILNGTEEEGLPEGYVGHISLFHLTALLNKLFLKQQNVANNLLTAEEGFALDARMGKYLAETRAGMKQLVLSLPLENWKPTVNVPKATAAVFAETDTTVTYTLTMEEGWTYATGCEVAFDVAQAATDVSAKVVSIKIGEGSWAFVTSPTLTVGKTVVVKLVDAAGAYAATATLSSTVYTEKTPYTQNVALEGLTADTFKSSVVYTVPDESLKAVQKAKAAPVKQGDGILTFSAAKKPSEAMSFGILLITTGEAGT